MSLNAYTYAVRTSDPPVSATCRPSICISGVPLLGIDIFYRQAFNGSIEQCDDNIGKAFHGILKLENTSIFNDPHPKCIVMYEA